MTSATNEVKEINPLSIKDALDPADVLLVVSPTIGVIMPLLGVHLLQASCRQAGIEARVLYTNLLYADLVGPDNLVEIVNDYYVLLCERVFAFSAFNQPCVSIRHALPNFFDPAWAPDHAWTGQHPNGEVVPEPVVLFRNWLGRIDLEELERKTNLWLDGVAEEIIRIGFRVVGCSTTFGGLLPAIALLNRIKKKDPEVITIIGGVLCDDEMAEGVLSLNTGIDYIFSGEGEISFPIFVKEVLAGRLPRERIIVGAEITDLDTVPLPLYTDYVRQREIFLGWHFTPDSYGLPYETSRGCNYGKCTFCGLNGKRNLYRCKSPDVIINDIKKMTEQHNCHFIYTCDTMMPLKFFETFLPRVATEIPTVHFFYEMKCGLKIEQVMALKQGGIVKIISGLESLSTSLLRKMQKPNTLRDNIALLRYTRMADIELQWNILFGLPGDETAEYESMIRIMPLLRHLEPPTLLQPLILWRYSKYYTTPGKYNVTELLPAAIFKETLPPHADLEKIAYYLSAQYPSQSRENPAVIRELWKEFQAWGDTWSFYKTLPFDVFRPTLHVTQRTPDLFIVDDTRKIPGLPDRMGINRKQAALILVPRRLQEIDAADIAWAQERSLAICDELWFIPLATADPNLLIELQQELYSDRVQAAQ